MAASNAGLDWPQGSPTTDPSPSIFPDRPIRPLPKRRLRARLSEEQAEAIVYPPAPTSSSPLFSSPSAHSATGVHPASTFGGDHHYPLSDSHNHNRLPPPGGYHSDPDSDEEHEENGPTRTNLGRGPSKSRPNHSTTSSGDGYESFENTNNKKKRKIPQNQPSGGLIEDLDIRQAAAYQLDGASSPSAPDAPLGRAADRPAAQISLESAKKPSRADWSGPVAGLPRNSYSGQERPRSATRKPPATKTHNTGTTPYPFSFERDSQSSNKLKEAPRPPMSNPVPRDIATQTPADQRPPPQQHQQHSQQRPAGQSDQPPPMSKKQQYKQAAQERRRSQVAINARYLQQRKDVQLCEFCEYKAIWHYSPRALIKRYEEKDLKRRQELDNRRRLLEKAKAKGRKQKKGSKGNKHNVQQQSAGHDAPPPNDTGDDDAYDDPDGPYDDDLAPNDAQSPGEEYFDDPDYDNQDDYGGYYDPPGSQQYIEPPGTGRAELPPPPPPPPPK